ncbi:MAG: DNA-processing protein DprA [Haloechinothrix sp.]
MLARQERKALVALLRYTEAGQHWRQTAQDIAEVGSAAEVLASEVGGQLFDDPTEALMQHAAADIHRWESDGMRVLSLFDEDYPSQLRDVYDFPPLLFARGAVVKDDSGICLVGSRQASAAGLAFTREIASALIDEGLTVISGLAKGIDAAAHTAALARAGRTVAVIGTGIDQYYPAENAALQRRIEADGLVLSQFWPGSSPTKQTFPMRNATMSAYGEATLIIEAGERSGARIQARQAIAHGRPLLLTSKVVSSTRWGRDLAATPGDVHVVTDVDDALAAIGAILERRHTINELAKAP